MECSWTLGSRTNLNKAYNGPPIHCLHLHLNLLLSRSSIKHDACACKSKGRLALPILYNFSNSTMHSLNPIEIITNKTAVKIAN